MMGKFCGSIVLDAALMRIASSTAMVAVSGEPRSYDEVCVGALAICPLRPFDFSLSDDDAQGRKVVVASKAGVEVSNTGTADHIALIDSEQTALVYVTTCPPQALKAGGLVKIASWSVAIVQPE